MGVLEFVNKSITGITSPMPKISSIVVIIKKKTKIIDFFLKDFERLL